MDTEDSAFDGEYYQYYSTSSTYTDSDSQDGPAGDKRHLAKLTGDYKAMKDTTQPLLFNTNCNSRERKMTQSCKLPPRSKIRSYEDISMDKPNRVANEKSTRVETNEDSDIIWETLLKHDLSEEETRENRHVARSWQKDMNTLRNILYNMSDTLKTKAEIQSVKETLIFSDDGFDIERTPSVVYDTMNTRYMKDRWYDGGTPPAIVSSILNFDTSSTRDLVMDIDRDSWVAMTPNKMKNTIHTSRQQTTIPVERKGVIHPDILIRQHAENLDDAWVERQSGKRDINTDHKKQQQFTQPEYGKHQDIRKTTDLLNETSNEYSGTLTANIDVKIISYAEGATMQPKEREQTIRSPSVIYAPTTENTQSRAKDLRHRQKKYSKTSKDSRSKSQNYSTSDTILNDDKRDSLQFGKQRNSEYYFDSASEAETPVEMKSEDHKRQVLMEKPKTREQPRDVDAGKRVRSGDDMRNHLKQDGGTAKVESSERGNKQLNKELREKETKYRQERGRDMINSSKIKAEEQRKNELKDKGIKDTQDIETKRKEMRTKETDKDHIELKDGRAKHRQAAEVQQVPISQMKTDEHFNKELKEKEAIYRQKEEIEKKHISENKADKDETDKKGKIKSVKSRVVELEDKENKYRQETKSHRGSISQPKSGEENKELNNKKAKYRQEEKEQERITNMKADEKHIMRLEDKNSKYRQGEQPVRGIISQPKVDEQRKELEDNETKNQQEQQPVRRIKSQQKVDEQRKELKDNATNYQQEQQQVCGIISQPKVDEKGKESKDKETEYQQEQQLVRGIKSHQKEQQSLRVSKSQQKAGEKGEELKDNETKDRQEPEKGRTTKIQADEKPVVGLEKKESKYRQEQQSVRGFISQPKVDEHRKDLVGKETEYRQKGSDKEQTQKVGVKEEKEDENDQIKEQEKEGNKEEKEADQKQIKKVKVKDPERTTIYDFKTFPDDKDIKPDQILKNYGMKPIGETVNQIEKVRVKEEKEVEKDHVKEQAKVENKEEKEADQKQIKKVKVKDPERTSIYDFKTFPDDKDIKPDQILKNYGMIPIGETVSQIEKGQVKEEKEVEKDHVKEQAKVENREEKEADQKQIKKVKLKDPERTTIYDFKTFPEDKDIKPDKISKSYGMIPIGETVNQGEIRELKEIKYQEKETMGGANEEQNEKVRENEIEKYKEKEARGHVSEKVKEQKNEKEKEDDQKQIKKVKVKDPERTTMYDFKTFPDDVVLTHEKSSKKYGMIPIGETANQDEIRQMTEKKYQQDRESKERADKQQNEKMKEDKIDQDNEKDKGGERGKEGSKELDKEKDVDKKTNKKVKVKDPERTTMYDFETFPDDKGLEPEKMGKNYVMLPIGKAAIRDEIHESKESKKEDTKPKKANKDVAMGDHKHEQQKSRKSKSKKYDEYDGYYYYYDSYADSKRTTIYDFKTFEDNVHMKFDSGKGKTLSVGHDLAIDEARIKSQKDEGNKARDIKIKTAAKNESIKSKKDYDYYYYDSYDDPERTTMYDFESFEEAAGDGVEGIIRENVVNEINIGIKVGEKVRAVKDGAQKHSRKSKSKKDVYSGDDYYYYDSYDDSQRTTIYDFESFEDDGGKLVGGKDRKPTGENDDKNKDKQAPQRQSIKSKSKKHGYSDYGYYYYYDSDNDSQRTTIYDFVTFEDKAHLVMDGVNREYAHVVKPYVENREVQRKQTNKSKSRKEDGDDDYYYYYDSNADSKRTTIYDFKTFEDSGAFIPEQIPNQELTLKHRGVTDKASKHIRGKSTLHNKSRKSKKNTDDGEYSYYYYYDSDDDSQRTTIYDFETFEYGAPVDMNKKTRANAKQGEGLVLDKPQQNGIDAKTNGQIAEFKQRGTHKQSKKSKSAKYDDDEYPYYYYYDSGDDSQRTTIYDFVTFEDGGRLHNYVVNQKETVDKEPENLGRKSSKDGTADGYPAYYYYDSDDDSQRTTIYDFVTFEDGASPDKHKMGKLETKDSQKGAKIDRRAHESRMKSTKHTKKSKSKKDGYYDYYYYYDSEDDSQRTTIYDFVTFEDNAHLRPNTGIGGKLSPIVEAQYRANEGSNMVNKQFDKWEDGRGETKQDVKGHEGGDNVLPTKQSQKSRTKTTKKTDYDYYPYYYYDSYHDTKKTTIYDFVTFEDNADMRNNQGYQQRLLEAKKSEERRAGMKDNIDKAGAHNKSKRTGSKKAATDDDNYYGYYYYYDDYDDPQRTTIYDFESFEDNGQVTNADKIHRTPGKANDNHRGDVMEKQPNARDTARKQQKSMKSKSKIEQYGYEYQYYYYDSYGDSKKTTIDDFESFEEDPRMRNDGKKPITNRLSVLHEVSQEPSNILKQSIKKENSPIKEEIKNAPQNLIVDEEPEDEMKVESKQEIKITNEPKNTVMTKEQKAQLKIDAKKMKEASPDKKENPAVEDGIANAQQKPVLTKEQKAQMKIDAKKMKEASPEKKENPAVEDGFANAQEKPVLTKEQKAQMKIDAKKMKEASPDNKENPAAEDGIANAQQKTVLTKEQKYQLKIDAKKMKEVSSGNKTNPDVEDRVLNAQQNHVLIKEEKAQMKIEAKKIKEATPDKKENPAVEEGIANSQKKPVLTKDDKEKKKIDAKKMKEASPDKKENIALEDGIANQQKKPVLTKEEKEKIKIDAKKMK